MNTEDVIKLGITMGLKFDRKSNYPDTLDSGIVVFNGCNGQRFLIDTNHGDDSIYADLGIALITYGKRLKCVEFSNVISINND